MKAFPSTNKSSSKPHDYYDGMDLRDYFAATALNGILSSYAYPEDTNPRLFATHVYRIADAMMEARKNEADL